MISLKETITKTKLDIYAGYMRHSNYDTILIKMAIPVVAVKKSDVGIRVCIDY